MTKCHQEADLGGRVVLEVETSDGADVSYWDGDTQAVSRINDVLSSLVPALEGSGDPTVNCVEIPADGLAQRNQQRFLLDRNNRLLIRFRRIWLSALRYPNCWSLGCRCSRRSGQTRVERAI